MQSDIIIGKCNAHKMNSLNMRDIFVSIRHKNHIIWIMEASCIGCNVIRKEEKEKKLHDKFNHQGFINTMHIKTNLVQSRLIQAHVALLIRCVCVRVH